MLDFTSYAVPAHRAGHVIRAACIIFGASASNLPCDADILAVLTVAVTSPDAGVSALVDAYLAAIA
jgi:hypothetical protein